MSSIKTAIVEVPLVFTFSTTKMSAAIRMFTPESPTVKCFHANHTRNGSFFEDNDMDYLIRIFPLQVSLTALSQTICSLLLKPFGQTPVVAQILGGYIIGPGGLMHFSTFKRTMYPVNGGSYLCETLGMFGCMIYIFLMGVKLDLSTLKISSKKEWVIGISTFTFPLMLTLPVSFYAKKTYPTDYVGFKDSLTKIAILISATSFHTVSCFLSDLKILNTELGRIASSASTISGLCSWITIIIASRTNKFTGTPYNMIYQWVVYISAILVQIIFITFILRSLVIWMIKSTPRDEPLKEMYLFSIIVMVLATGLISEWSGHNALFGPMILGLAIPVGPPVGSALVDKLDSFSSGLLLPIYCFSIGLRVNYRLLRKSDMIAVVFSGLSLLGKLIGTVIPCLFYKIPIRDAFTLGLILNVVGIFDVQTYSQAEDVYAGYYTFMLTTAMGVTGMISSLVRLLYNPSRRYIVYQKRTIQNVKINFDLRILVCIYDVNNVPTIINILEASNPTRETPIVIYLLHLVELQGRSTPLIITHNTQGNGRISNNRTLSATIINSFKIFEKQHQGVVHVQPFTSITPFLSAHDDICTVALDRKTSLVIIPFHVQLNIDGTSKNLKWSTANQKVLTHAPCSVGILIDRGMLKGTRSVLSNWSTYNVGVIFLGDADDREALCYALRMAGNPNVFVTVHRLLITDKMAQNLTEKILDTNVINEYRYNFVSDRNLYKEEVVEDGVGIINVIRSMENCYNLILVGRRHYSCSRILVGLTEMNEYPELGFFGDILASSDFKDHASILIVQQHSCTSVYQEI